MTIVSISLQNSSPCLTKRCISSYPFPPCAREGKGGRERGEKEKEREKEREKEHACLLSHSSSMQSDSLSLRGVIRAETPSRVLFPSFTLATAAGELGRVTSPADSPKTNPGNDSFFSAANLFLSLSLGHTEKRCFLGAHALSRLPHTRTVHYQAQYTILLLSNARRLIIIFMRDAGYVYTQLKRTFRGGEMSLQRVEVLWSPNNADEFATYCTELRIYRVQVSRQYITIPCSITAVVCCHRAEEQIQLDLQVNFDP